MINWSFLFSRTPLHCAASCNNLKMVRALVERGGCVFATTISDKESPAEKCEKEEDGYLGCFEYLNGKDWKLWLYYAMKNKSLCCIVRKACIVMHGRLSNQCSTYKNTGTPCWKNLYSVGVKIFNVNDIVVNALAHTINLLPDRRSSETSKLLLRMVKLDSNLVLWFLRGYFNRLCKFVICLYYVWDSLYVALSN